MIAVWTFIGGISGILRFALGLGVMFIISQLVLIPIATSKALTAYEDLYRVKSLGAENAELKRQIEAGKTVIEAYQVQYRNAIAKQEADNAEDEKRISDYEALLRSESRSCKLTPADRQFLLDGK